MSSGASALFGPCNVLEIIVYRVAGHPQLVCDDAYRAADAEDILILELLNDHTISLCGGQALDVARFFLRAPYSF